MTAKYVILRDGTRTPAKLLENESSRLIWRQGIVHEQISVEGLRLSRVIIP